VMCITMKRQITKNSINIDCVAIEVDLH